MKEVLKISTLWEGLINNNNNNNNKGHNNKLFLIMDCYTIVLQSMGPYIYLVPSSRNYPNKRSQKLKDTKG